VCDQSPAAQFNFGLEDLAMFSRRALSILLIVALVLLIAVFALLAAGRLLAAMDDRGPADVVDIITVIVASAFAVDLICLVLLQGFVLLSVWEEEPHEHEVHESKQ
jgi:hypothetical protein